MTEHQPTFKYNVGDTVSGHKPRFGKITGVITGRTILSQGTPLYWVMSNGQTFKFAQHQLK